jgi:hypothetical protein
MGTISIILISVFVITLFWLSEYKKFLATKYEGKLLMLRGRLRAMKSSGMIVDNNWAYERLEESMTITMRGLKYVSIWYATVMFIINRKDKNLIIFREKFVSEINKNEHLKNIYDEYGDILGDYLRQKHFISRVVFVFIKSAYFVTSFLVIKIRESSINAVKELQDEPVVNMGLQF